MVRSKQFLALLLIWGVAIATSPAGATPLPQEAAPANVSASQIDALVAPIALYPDALVAQVLAASTYPNEVVEASQWMRDNSSLQGTALANAVNQQPWDPSVQALTQFPSVLDQMANNLSWTSALGDAFYNQQADVMASVQRLRAQAKAAGNLKSTSQMTVVQESPQTIVIQPANPQVVYVPTYNPTVIYGTPYYPPGYSTGALVATGLISFGVGMAVGAAMSNSWGWNSWGCGWHGGTVVYNRNVYVSRSNVYANGNRYNNGNWNRPTPYGSNNYNRNGNNNYNRNRNTNVSGNTVNINNGNRTNNNVNNGNRPNNGNNNGNLGQNRPNNGNNAGQNRPNANQGNRPQQPATRPANSAYRGYSNTPSTGTKTGALSGYGAGGSARAESDRGRASYGGGGANRGSGGGSRGGGGRGGGGRR